MLMAWQNYRTHAAMEREVLYPTLQKKMDEAAMRDTAARLQRNIDQAAENPALIEPKPMRT